MGNRGASCKLEGVLPRGRIVFGTWRSPVAHCNGVAGVAGSNPAVPIEGPRVAMRLGDLCRRRGRMEALDRAGRSRGERGRPQAAALQSGVQDSRLLDASTRAVTASAARAETPSSLIETRTGGAASSVGGTGTTVGRGRARRSKSGWRRTGSDHDQSGGTG